MISLLIAVSSVLGVVSGSLSCIGDDGNPVDMYILYKLPRIKWDDVPDVVATGHGYTYLDSNSMDFKLSQHSIADDSSAAGQTLDQVYKRYPKNEEFYTKADGVYSNGPDDLAHIFYNDENPDGTHWYEDCGHTKGAVAFDKESGFWMITSVPKYPSPAPGDYIYPHTGCMYGQMFMCVSFNASSFDTIGMQLSFNDPHIHDSHLPPKWNSLFPNIRKVIKGERVKREPFTSVFPLKSLNGVEYLSFAKAGGFHEDLYRDFVAPTLKADILVETWQHDRAKNINSSCDVQYTVEEILKLNITLPDQSYHFLNYNDHSKFVVGKTEPVVCVGDINRAITQFRRGGGTMCVRNEQIWNLFNGFLTGIEQCHK